MICGMLAPCGVLLNMRPFNRNDLHREEPVQSSG